MTVVVCYQEYHCVYGEDVEALRFLFTAMSAKAIDGFLQGIPQMIYTDNGPILKSRIVSNVVECLDIQASLTCLVGRMVGGDSSLRQVERPLDGQSS